MPREPNPIDDEDLFDVIELGGVTSPGQVVSISGHERKINWDVKEGQGQSGASSTLKSIPLRTFTVTIFLADGDDLSPWPAWRGLCLSTITGPKPKALDIYHPDLAVVGIKSAVLASLGGPQHDGKGGQTVAIVFQEYAPPKPKGGTATGSKAKGPDPNAAANKELAELVATNAATPWGHL